jgi:long-chain fatty acid transport protein
MEQMRLDNLARRLLVVGALAATASLAVVHPAGAQGFGLNEVGSCSVGRAGAGVAAPCADASRIYWNPAAAVRLPGVQLLVGAAAVAVDGRFTADISGRVHDGDVPVEVPPHLFATYQVQSRFNVGLGVYVPYGLTSQWKDDFPGRFSAQKASLASIYIQPNFAFDVVPGKFAVGGGPVVGISDVELIQGVDLAQQMTPAGVTFGQLGIPANTEFARAGLKGQSVAWGYDVGVHWQVVPSVAIGARYLSEINFEYNGATAEFTQMPTGLTLAANNPLGLPGNTPVDAVVGGQFAAGGALTTRGVQTAISHPAQAQVGLGITAIPNTTLNLDYAWVGWSSFRELPVNFQGANAPPDRVLIEDYDNSWAVRGSVDYAFGNGWVGQLGSSYVRTPVPDFTVTPLLPDMDRYNFAGGLSIPLTEHFAVDASYLRVETKGRRGRIVERTDRAQTAQELNGGFYNLNANILSLSLRASF